MRKTVSTFFIALVFFITTALPALADFKTGFGPATDTGISAQKAGGTFQAAALKIGRCATEARESFRRNRKYCNTLKKTSIIL
jgi:hypothetical protein